MRKMIISQESIDFQDGKFFKALTQCIDEIRNAIGNKKVIKFTSSDFDPLSYIIKKYTNISIDFEEGGPAIYLPTLTNNHIFIDNETREVLNEYKQWDSFSDARDLMKNMEKTTIKGEISLLNSTVSGAYSKMKFRMLLPSSFFRKTSHYTASEAAAIILHETGHAFTTIEFLSRFVTTNQVLAGMTRALDKSVSPATRKAVFSKGADLLKMTEDEREATLNSTNDKTLTCVVMDAAIRTSVSELGASVYDVNSCEQLADQFAARHGAGRELVIALDKLMNDYSIVESVAGYAMLFLVIASWVVVTYGAILLLLPLIIFVPNKADEIYDNTKARFTRIKLQNVEALKNKDLTNEFKKDIIQTNEIIDNLCRFYDDNLNFVEKIAYYLRPSYRNAHKYELLQKDLELIASNDLFTSSARLTLK